MRLSMWSYKHRANMVIDRIETSIFFLLVALIVNKSIFTSLFFCRSLMFICWSYNANKVDQLCSVRTKHRCFPVDVCPWIIDIKLLRFVSRCKLFSRSKWPPSSIRLISFLFWLMFHDGCYYLAFSLTFSFSFLWPFPPPSSIKICM